VEILIDALKDAIWLLRNVDRQLLEIVGLTMQVTGMALFLAMVTGVPIGVFLGLRRRIPAGGCLLPVIYTGMGLPPVVVGLLVYILLSNRGPMGELRWLFTPAAMVMAQTIISFPLVVGLTLTAVRSLPDTLPFQIKALGATRWQLAWTMLMESRLGLLAAIVAAFGSIISEVGAVILVGGNIAGETRVLTTAIVLETRKGNFALALALGMILLFLAFTANFLLYHLQKEP
jgi:tungstate transport system permease protein